MKHLAFIYICLPLLNILNTSGQTISSYSTGSIWNLSIPAVTQLVGNDTSNINIDSNWTSVVQPNISDQNGNLFAILSSLLQSNTSGPAIGNITVINGTLFKPNLVQTGISYQLNTTSSATTQMEPVTDASAQRDPFHFLLSSLMFCVYLVIEL